MKLLFQLLIIVSTVRPSTPGSKVPDMSTDGENEIHLEKLVPVVLYGTRNNISVAENRRDPLQNSNIPGGPDAIPDGNINENFLPLQSDQHPAPSAPPEEDLHSLPRAAPVRKVIMNNEYLSPEQSFKIDVDCGIVSNTNLCEQFKYP